MPCSAHWAAILSANTFDDASQFGAKKPTFSAGRRFQKPSMSAFFALASFAKLSRTTALNPEPPLIRHRYAAPRRMTALSPKRTPVFSVKSVNPRIIGLQNGHDGTGKRQGCQAASIFQAVGSVEPYRQITDASRGDKVEAPGIGLTHRLDKEILALILHWLPQRWDAVRRRHHRIRPR